MAQDKRKIEARADSTLPPGSESQAGSGKGTGFTRRKFLQSSGVGAAVLVAGAVKPSRLFASGQSSAPAVASPGAADALAAAKDAYVWGFPLVLSNKYFQLALDNNVPLNRFSLSTRLSTPADKVAGPNNDTLYGFAWVDLTKEPVILSVPDTNGRYYSIQLIDAYGNTFTYVGRRVTGTAAGEFALVPPGWTGSIPDGVHTIPAPTNHVLALTRTLVSGDADLAAAQAIQNQYGLLPLSSHGQTPLAPLTPESALNVFPVLHLAGQGAQFFDDLGAGLALQPPPPIDGSSLDQFAKIGVGPNQRPSQSQDAAVLSALRDAVPTADALIRNADYSTRVNGWSVNYKVTNFITDPLLRAATTYYGLGYHVAQEALYWGPGREDQLLSGANKYSLKFAAGNLPPVDAFWSLTIYDSNLYLVENPINRYAVGDRTAGLQYGADGSLEILIQHDAPVQGTSNWLPAPAGPFRVTLRTYQPRPALFNGDYHLPPLVKA